MSSAAGTSGTRDDVICKHSAIECTVLQAMSATLFGILEKETVAENLFALLIPSLPVIEKLPDAIRVLRCRTTKLAALSSAITEISAAAGDTVHAPRRELKNGLRQRLTDLIRRHNGMRSALQLTQACARLRRAAPLASRLTGLKQTLKDRQRQQARDSLWSLGARLNIPEHLRLPPGRSRPGTQRMLHTWKQSSPR